MICSSCLILDELIERETFGENWESLFIDTINKMAEDVLYNPQEIDFSVTEDSQKYFERILHAGVYVEVHAACDLELRKNELLI